VLVFVPQGWRSVAGGGGGGGRVRGQSAQFPQMAVGEGGGVGLGWETERDGLGEAPWDVPVTGLVERRLQNAVGGIVQIQLLVPTPANTGAMMKNASYQGRFKKSQHSVYCHVCACVCWCP